MGNFISYKCLYNSFGYWLTEGKIYHIECDVTPNKSLITNDIGRKHFLFEDELKKGFITLEDWRQQQLNKIL
jgi:hypothetical protein